MPQELVAKIEASNTFNQGYATVSYLSSAIVDMDLHTQALPPTDIDAFEKASLALSERQAALADAEEEWMSLEEKAAV